MGDVENGGRLKIHAAAGARLGKGYMVGHYGVTISGREASKELMEVDDNIIC
jgi:hypothetical protein